MVNLKIHQRHLLKNKDIKQLRVRLEELFGESVIEAILPPKSKVEWFKLDNHEELIAINNVLAFWIKEDIYIPLLSLLINKDINFNLKTITVDKGAIPYVTNGADIMRPGIVQIDSTIREGDIVKIQDETYKRALAVGIALFDASEIESMKKGKVVKNIHTINDEIWQFSKSF
ncbi:MAG: PUA domain-containing protein [Promethearchaeota archaeon]